MVDASTRDRVIEVARTFLGTPFHDGAHLKGVGIDCAQFLAMVYEEAGVIPHLEIEPYSPQWMLHEANEPIFENVVRKFATEIVGPPLRGDVVLYKVGRMFAHGAIVIDWPTKIIHAFKQHGMVIETPADEGDLMRRERRFFTVWG